MILAGIDGGATRTRAALASDDGTIVGFGEAGPSNYDNVGVETARENIRSAVKEAWRATGRPMRPCDGAFCGMAGVVSEQDRETIRTMAREIGLAPGRNVDIDHDLRIALAGGLAGNEGLVLIVGTGSSCYGRRTDGKDHRTGWGYLLDDLGSGYFLGLQAMIAVIRAADGRGIATTLSARLRNELKYSHIDEIMRILYHDSERVSNVAALAPVVLEEAKNGDEAALSIIERGAEELSVMVAAVTTKLAFRSDVPLVIVGGVAEQSAFYRTKIESAILHRVPKCRIQPPVLPPVLGAVLLALEQSGHGDRAGMIRKLKETSHMM